MTRATKQVWIDCGLIALAWASLLLAFAIGDWLGWGTSLRIAAMGEDQNWIALLQSGDAATTAQNFWRIDSRNPLSPWFYVLARPLILGFGSGLAKLHFGVALALALSCYALLRQVFEGAANAPGWPRGRWFVVATAAGVAVNLSNAYFDHIIWNFQLALCFSLLSVAAYLRFIRDRAQIGWYGLSLCLWAMAFQTYTLQSGAIIGIGLCHLRMWLRTRDPALSGVAAARHYVGAAIAELLPFALVYAVFTLVWTTTAVTVGGGFGYTFSGVRLLGSIGQGLFHSDTALMVEILKISPNAIALIGLGVVTAIVVSFAWKRGTGAHQPIGSSWTDHLFVLALVVALALPTIVLESGGAGWPPGSRWRMIYQFTSPVLAMLVVVLVLRHRGAIRFAAMILMVGWVTMALIHNERQARLTQSEGRVRDAIRGMLDERADNSKPLLAILEIDERFRWFASETLRGVYMKNWFPGVAVELRFLPSPIYQSLSYQAPLQFNADGVTSDNGITRATYTYDNVAIFRASERTVTRRSKIFASDVRAHHGDWQLGVDSIDLIPRP